MIIHEAYTTKELAALLGITQKYILKRSVDENWQPRHRARKLGGSEWLVASMPEATRIAVTAAAAKAATELAKADMPKEVALSLPGLAAPALPSLGDVVTVGAISENQRRKALLKADLLKLYLAHLKRHGKSLKERDRFVALYLDGTWPQILEGLGEKIAWKTIEKWKVAMRSKDGLMAIVDTRGAAHRGRSILTERHHTIMLGLLLNPNAPHVSQCARKAQARCREEGLAVPSEATFRRFAERFMAESYQDFIFWREGKKAWNDKCNISILRDWDLIDVGDVVFGDGHVLNFETLDPDTKKPKRMTLLLFYDGRSACPLGWEVMSSENTACISSAFRRACLILGKIPRVVYIDNGKAFRAEYFKGTKNFEEAGFLGLYTSLGCEVIHAWAYHGQSKPIERFFGIMHEMEVFTPPYTGNDIDHKPARMKRGEKLHGKLYEKLGGRPLSHGLRG